MEKVGLIAAMAQERNALLRCSGGWKKATVGDLPAYQKEIGGANCILVTSGMGMKRAAEAAGKLIEGAAVQYLISFGIAGAAQESLEIGDVILVDAVHVMHSGQPGEPVPLQRWSQAAYEAAKRSLAGRGAQVYTGTAITTGGSQLTETELAGINHPVLEMETMGIAEAAAERGVPFLAVRSISDGPKAPIPFDLGEMMDGNANMRIGKLLGEIARHPGMIGGLGMMMRNSKLAEVNAAIALVALLDQQFANEI